MSNHAHYMEYIMNVINCDKSVNALVVKQFVLAVLEMERNGELLPYSNLTPRLEFMLETLQAGKNMYFNMSNNSWYTVSDEGKLGTREMMWRILLLVPKHFTSTHNLIHYI